MANKQTSDLGVIQQPGLPGRISQDVPAFAVNTSGGWKALSGQTGSLADQLRGMAAQAAMREGALAGLKAGQEAGAAYLQQRTSEHAADARVIGQAGVDVDHINADALGRFARLQDRFGQTLTINSGYRDPARNAAVGGARNSQHLHGNALDISIEGLSQDQVRSLIEGATAEGFGGVAVYDGHLHVDTGARRTWGNNPEWAEDLIEAHLASPDPGLDLLPPGEGNGLQPLPLQLRRDGTIFGQAFDDAAMRAQGWRMQAGLQRDLAAAFEQHKDDPAAWRDAVSGIAGQYRSGLGNDPEVIEAFDRSFQTEVMADQLQVVALQEQRLRQDEIAAATEGLDTQAGELERQAYNLGANGDADAILGPRVDRALARIDGAFEQNLITAAKREQLRDQLGERIARARIEGTFAALDSPAAQEAYAQQIIADWSAGEGPVADLGYGEAMALSQTLFSRARAAVNQQTASQRVEAGELRALLQDDLASIAATGQPVTTDSGPIDPATVERLLGAEGLADWQNGRADAQQAFEAVNGMEIQNRGEIFERLEVLQPEAGTPGFEVQTAIYEAAQKRATEILEERETDPLGQAARAGAIDLKPIDFSDPQALDQSLQQRRFAAEAVADMYGQPARYFRPEETTALADALMQNPDLLPGFAVNVSETFGDAAPQVLSELSEAGPAVAHAAGLVLDSGDMSVVTDISRVLAARADSTGTRLQLPTANKFGTVAASIMGGALQSAPGTRGAAEQVAQLLFEREAQLFGFDTGAIDEPGSAAHSAFVRSLNRALGASFRNGEQRGGLGTVNGTQTILPANMTAQRAQTLITGLTEADLTGQMQLGQPNQAFTINPNRLRSARLVAVGDGQYLMALGDPNGPDPQFVPGAGRGGFFVLDIRVLERQRQRRTGAMDGGAFGLSFLDRGMTPADPEGVGP